MSNLSTHESPFTRKAQVLDTGVVLFFTIEEDKGLVKPKRARQSNGHAAAPSPRIKVDGSTEFNQLRMKITNSLRSLGVKIAHGNFLYVPDRHLEEIRIRVAQGKSLLSDFNDHAESVGWTVRGKMSAVFVPMTKETSSSVKECVREAMRDNFAALHELIRLGQVAEARLLISSMDNAKFLFRAADQDPMIHAIQRAAHDINAMVRSKDYVAYASKLDLKYLNFCESFYGSPDENL